MESLTVAEARRLALARGGLLKPEWTGFPRGWSASRREAAYEVIRRFGYLQLDTVSVAGARSHGIVLHSRLPGLGADVPETLLRPEEPIFEYWAHEASWVPIELYPVFAFRRKEFQKHPWWGDLIGENPAVASAILERIRKEGPLRSSDLEGRTSSGWWNLSVAKKVVSALWSAGTLAVRERRNFQRIYDLTDRVIPARWRKDDMSLAEALEILLMKALEGHGWASTSTLVATWRFRFLRKEIGAALAELERKGSILRCAVVSNEGARVSGWIRPSDLDLATRLRRVRPPVDGGVLLSPFDPLLWDRTRVMLLFGFHQVLEVFTPAPARKYGYYCMPVLAGERLVARCDVKAVRNEGVMKAMSVHLENGAPRCAKRSTRGALERYAASLGLALSR
ncbi:MAG: winged helix-turn-helix domain-containing protein [Vicinamibacteria bacterium]